MQSTKTDEEKLSLQPVFLSDVELYYSGKTSNDLVEISGDECHHILDVMRHHSGDEIYVTDGCGAIYLCLIQNVLKNKIDCKIITSMHYENDLKKITFCVPRMKSSERFEFALEKAVELGITNFVVFESKRTIGKGERLERWQKVLKSAMKQSLRAWLPKIKFVKNLSLLFDAEGAKIIFDQNADDSFVDWIATNNQRLLTNDHYFIFGPEGGFGEDELQTMPTGRQVANCKLRIRLTENRLRSETAIVTAASILATNV